MDVVLPEKTARELTLPDGTEVWIKTLNSFKKEEAQQKAELFAARATREMRKPAKGGTGGADYETILDLFRAREIEEQARWLAEGRMDERVRLIHEKDPPRECPVRQEGQSDAAWVAAVDAWEVDNLAAIERRRAAIEAAFVQECEAAKKLAESTRLERCALEFWRREFVKLQNVRLLAEILSRAVRHRDDHARYYFADAKGAPDADKIADLDDVTIHALWTNYEALQVAAAMVPTSAASS